jgi:hypothetical protein
VCSPNSACVAAVSSTGAPGMATGCVLRCVCGVDGALQCSESCSPGPDTCTPGVVCAPNSGCQLAPASVSECPLDCVCDATMHLTCTSCQAPLPAGGCAQWGPCSPGETCSEAADDGGCTACSCSAGGLLNCTPCDQDASLP